MNISDKIRLETINCPLGCDSTDEHILKGSDILNDIPGEFSVVRCNNCGLCRTNPRPSFNTIGDYYPDDYGPYVGTQISYKKNYFPLKFLKKIFNTNTEIIPKIPIGNMLEVGCASGSFLEKMKKKGWSVKGIEVSEKAAKLAQASGHEVHITSLENIDNIDSSFDLIVGWMVVEHLHEPVEGLKKLHEWAAPDAYLVISVPNMASLEFKIFSDYWYALQVPTHLFHFTPKTIEKVLNAAGWKVEKIFHQRILSNFVASLGYVMKKNGFKKIGQTLINMPEDNSKILSIVLFPIAYIMSIFGQTGRMTIWATKK